MVEEDKNETDRITKNDRHRREQSRRKSKEEKCRTTEKGEDTEEIGNHRRLTK